MRTKSIYERFSKKSEDISKIKVSFIKNNEKLVKDNQKIIRFLKKQPLRKKCKNCGFKLNKKIDFYSHGMGYKICFNCTHLNSNNDDGKSFHKKIYNDSNFSYEQNYLKDFNLRVNNIYLPKVDFIKNFLKEEEIDNISLLDLGSGCGHFIKACEIRDISAKGLESNLKMIKLGEKYIKNNSVLHSENFEDSLKIIKNGNYTIISLIAVIEHLKDPNKIFKAFKISKNKYLFLSIPLFSLSVFIDKIFQNIYPRHTAATHPHIYTYKSIKYILKKFKLSICAEWWFGSDIIDLNRSLIGSIDKKSSKTFYNKLRETFANEINSLQSILDNKKLSSEVHLIIKKN